MAERNNTGGEGEIRTHGTREGSPVFKTGAINRSATSPIEVIVTLKAQTFKPNLLKVLDPKQDRLFTRNLIKSAITLQDLRN
jgi:hypothetical protein